MTADFTSHSKETGTLKNPKNIIVNYLSSDRVENIIFFLSREPP